jgi:hypothetical protein
MIALAFTPTPHGLQKLHWSFCRRPMRSPLKGEGIRGKAERVGACALLRPLPPLRGKDGMGGAA